MPSRSTRARPAEDASSASKKTKGETAEKPAKAPPASKRAAPDDSQLPAPKRAAPAKAAASAVKNPAVPELTSHPFFDDATPSLLHPDDNTSMEREALRAVTTGNVELLRTHLVGKAPLDEERDVVSLETPLAAAIALGSADAIRVIAAGLPGPSAKRVSSLTAQGTGEMSVLTLGIATGKIGVARGGKEMNNALLDARSDRQRRVAHLAGVVGCTPLSEELLALLCQQGVLEVQYGASKLPASAKMPLTQALYPALLAGNAPTLRFIVDKMPHSSRNFAVALGSDAAACKALSSKQVTAKSHIDNVCAIHLAAANPDAACLEAMLKVEPDALLKPTARGHSAIHVAAAAASAAPLKLLLGSHGADRRLAAPKDKRTPLHCAAAAGRVDNIYLLLGHESAPRAAGGGASGLKFAKEIRALLVRRGQATKIGADGVALLSTLLLDLLARVAAHGGGLRSAAAGVAPKAAELADALPEAPPPPAAKGAKATKAKAGAKEAAKGKGPAAAAKPDARANKKAKVGAAASSSARGKGKGRGKAVEEEAAADEEMEVDDAAGAGEDDEEEAEPLLPMLRLSRQMSDKMEALSEERARALFDEYDADGSDALERAELEKVFKAAGLRLSKRQLETLISEVDEDGNGAVSFDEFSAWLGTAERSGAAAAVRRQLVLSEGSMRIDEVEEAEEAIVAAQAAVSRQASEAAVSRQASEAANPAAAANSAAASAAVPRVFTDGAALLRAVAPDRAAAGDAAGDAAYALDLLEGAAGKLAEAAAEGAAAQGKSSIGAKHVVAAVQQDEDLQELFGEGQSTVLHTLMLPVKDKEGYAPLHTAAVAGCAGAVEALLRCGADPNVAGPDGKGALALAAERGHGAVVVLLLDAGAKLDAADKRKRTALLLAVRAGRAVEASLLLRRGANPNAADDSGNSVVHYACAFGWLECLGLLQAAGAALEAQNAMRLAAATAALTKGHTAVFRRMLALGTDVNFVSADGTTVLTQSLRAVSRGALSEVEFLLAKGADAAFASATGTTALHALASAKRPSGVVLAPSDAEAKRLAKLREACWAPRTVDAAEAAPAPQVRLTAPGFSTIGMPSAIKLSGHLYYEVTLHTVGPYPQIGWATAAFVTDDFPEDNGVGDCESSWAADGARKLKWHGGKTSWTVKWKNGDVVGVAADTVEGSLLFARNGEWVKTFDVEPNTGLFPALSISESEFTINTGASPFRYPPPAGFALVSLVEHNFVLMRGPSLTRRTGPVHRRAWAQLGASERDAVFALGWQEASWAAAQGPTAPWAALDEKQQGAAAVLGLGEATWDAAWAPVRWVTGPRKQVGRHGASDDSLVPPCELPTKKGHAVGITEDGMVTIVAEVDTPIESGGGGAKPPAQTVQVHVSLVLLDGEENLVMRERRDGLGGAQTLASHLDCAPHLSVALARALIDAGAPIDQPDSNGETPLLLALKAGATDLAIELLERGAAAQTATQPPSAKELAAPKETPLTAAAAAGEDLSNGYACSAELIAILVMKRAAQPHAGRGRALARLVLEGKIKAAHLLCDAMADTGTFSGVPASYDEFSEQASTPELPPGSALHHVFKHLWDASLDAPKANDEVPALMRALVSCGGARLWSVYSAQAPHVTPLHVLLKHFLARAKAVFSSSFATWLGSAAKLPTDLSGSRLEAWLTERREVWMRGSTALLLQLLREVPAEVNFADWLGWEQKALGAGPFAASAAGGAIALETVKPLSRHGAAASCTLPQGLSQQGLAAMLAEHAACFDCCPDLAAQLLQLLVERGLKDQLARSSGAHGRSALHALLIEHGCTLHDGPKLTKLLLPLSDLTCALPDGIRHPSTREPLAAASMLGYAISLLPKDEHGTEAVDLGTVQLLLDAGCEVSATDSGLKCAPLHLAAQRRSAQLVALLAKAGANPKALDGNGCTPLHVAVTAAPTGADATFDTEEELVCAGADVSARDRHGRTPLHYAFLKAGDGGGGISDLTELVTAEANGVLRWKAEARKALDGRIDPIETVASLCAVSGVDPNVADEAGLTPLHLAALRGACISALKLAKAGADVEAVWKGNTPLGLAMHAHPDLAVLLLQRGASTAAPCYLFATAQKAAASNPFGGGLFGNPFETRAPPSLPTASAGDGPDGSGGGAPESVFSLAVRQLAALQGAAQAQKQAQAAAPMLDKAAAYLGAAICALDCGFPLGAAIDDTISSRQLTMLSTLLPKVADAELVGLRFAGGGSVLHRLAGVAAASEAERRLLERALHGVLRRGVHPTKDDAGRWPLHLAAAAGALEFVRELAVPAAEGAPPPTDADADGITPIGYAVGGEKGAKAQDAAEVALRLKICAELVSRGASAAGALVKGGVGGKTVLMHCIDAEWPIETASSAAGEGEASALPASAPATAPMKDREASSWPVVLFGSARPDVLATDANGRTALHYAAGAGTAVASGSLGLLIAWAVDVDALLAAADADGVSPLMVAIDAGNCGFIRALLVAAGKHDAARPAALIAARASDGSTALVRAVRRACAPSAKALPGEGVWMVSELLSHLSDAMLSAQGESTVAGGRAKALQDSIRSALSLAVRHNSLPLLRALLAARPLPPAPASMTCPPGKVAGDELHLHASCDGVTGAGLPSYAVALAVDAAEVKEKVVEGRPAVGHHVKIKTRVGNSRTMSMPSLPFTITLPAGVGPGVDFAVEFPGSGGGPGEAGAAGAFAGAAAARIDGAVLGAAEGAEAWTLLHLCVRPLGCGSYENGEMLAALLDAGVPADARDARGRTAADLAAAQRSGTMLRALTERGAAARSGAANAANAANADDADDADLPFAPWPPPLAPHYDEDAAATLAAAETRAPAAAGPTAAPVDKAFSKPAANSRAAVAVGSDGQPLDLVMTKVDLKKGFYGQNVFYRMQVVHEANQDVYFLLTRWGRIGERGQHQQSPCEDAARAEAEFLKIFKSKAGNDWAAREAFVKKPDKYQYHQLRYGGVAPSEALRPALWCRHARPAQLAPAPLGQLLLAAASPELLSHALTQRNIETPLGRLERQPLTKARALLGQLGALLEQKETAERKAQGGGSDAAAMLDTQQRLADEMAAASSRLYELLPTKNFSHTNVPPISSRAELTEWIGRVEDTDELAVAARLLLGAQAKLEELPPADYLYRALGCRVVPLAAGSAELRLIESYINRTSPPDAPHCCLYDGDGALELPSAAATAAVAAAAATPAGAAKPPDVYWQAMCDAPCFADAACTAPAHEGPSIGDQLLASSQQLVAKAGGLFKQCGGSWHGSGGVASGAVCLRDKPSPLWCRRAHARGGEQLRQLSAREAASSVLAVHRVEPQADTAAEQSAFDALAADGGAELLFHGSSLANLLPILASGLRIKPPTASSHQGSAFGNGIYLSNSYAKSRGYCGLSNGLGCLLLCEVARGTPLPTAQFAPLASIAAHALLAERKRARGLALSAPPSDELRAEVADELGLPAHHGSPWLPTAALDNLSRVRGFDSLHYETPTAPEPAGTVVHPLGYRVPCGALQRRSRDEQASRQVYGTTRGGGGGGGGGGGATPGKAWEAARDEIVVYATERVRVRYVIELREGAQGRFAPMPEEKEAAEPAAADAEMDEEDEEMDDDDDDGDDDDDELDEDED